MEPIADLSSLCSKCRPVVASVFQYLSKVIDDFESQGINEIVSTTKMRLDSEFLLNLQKIIASVQPWCIAKKGIGKKPTRKTKGNIINNYSSDANTGQFNNNQDSGSEKEGYKENDQGGEQNQRRKIRARVSGQRANEIDRANKFLRTVRINTPKGFYLMYECLTCQRQLNNKQYAKRHVQYHHFNKGEKCPTCKNVYFNDDSLKLHIPKCARANRQRIEKQKVLISLPNKKTRSTNVVLHPYAKSPAVSQPQDCDPTVKRSFIPDTSKVKNPGDDLAVDKAVNYSQNLPSVQSSSCAKKLVKTKPRRTARRSPGNIKGSKVQKGQVNNNTMPILEEVSIENENTLSGKQKRRRIIRPRILTQRAKELDTADKCLRSIQMDTPEGFYTVYECLHCQHQFSEKRNAKCHAQYMHLNIGSRCPTCNSYYFNKKSLDLHIPKCPKTLKKRVRVSLSNRRKRPVKVVLHPYAKSSAASQPHDCDSPVKRSFNPHTIKVRNPFDGFDVDQAVNVRVVIDRLKGQNQGSFSEEKQGEEKEMTPETRDEQEKQVVTTAVAQNSVHEDHSKTLDLQKIRAELNFGKESSSFSH